MSSGSLLGRKAFDCAINIFMSIGYGSEKEDEAFFSALRHLVRKSGLYVIAQLVNRDYIASHFVKNLYEEFRKVLVLHDNELDVAHSRERSTWRFFLKEGKPYKFVGESTIDLRMYSPHEIVTMLERTNWKVTEVFDSITQRRPFSVGSPVFSMVAEAV